MRLPPPPAPEPAFSPVFRAALPALLAAAGRPRGAVAAQERSRRATLGDSGTFVGHRRYAPGDDLRRIDWAAYARSGELHTKRFEQEERRAATLLLDLSPRLCVGTPQRRLCMLRAAAVLGGAMLRELDALAVVAPGGPPSAVFAGGADLASLLDHLERLPIAAAPAAAALAPRLQRGLPKRVYWLSDFAVLEGVAAVLRAVRRRGGSVVGILPELASDRLPPPRGFVRVADPATGGETAVLVDAELAAAVAEQLAAHARAQQALFAEHGCRLLRWLAPAVDDLRAAGYRGLASPGAP